MIEKCGSRNFKDSFSHAILHESIPASQFNFLCSSLFFAARPFFATFFLLDPRLFSPSVNEGRRRKNRRRRLCKCNTADKDSGNGKDCERSKQLEHLYTKIPYFCELNSLSTTHACVNGHAAAVKRT